MQHIIREITTLIRIERWFVSDDSQAAIDRDMASEQVIEEIVLSSTEASHVRELVRRIMAQHHTEQHP